MDRYLVPASRAMARLNVKGSRFIAQIFPVKSKEEAEETYTTVKKQYYDATHNCFAYRIDEQIFRFSDDGEPSGTAGKPILQALEGQNLFEVLCVVTRYFGGTKLGTGGLIRAYGDATREALKSLKIKEKIKTASLQIKTDFAHENHIYHLLGQLGGHVAHSDYSNGVTFYVELPQSKMDEFLIKLQNATHGQFELIK